MIRSRCVTHLVVDEQHEVGHGVGRGWPETVLDASGTVVKSGDDEGSGADGIEPIDSVDLRNQEVKQLTCA